MSAPRAAAAQAPRFHAREAAIEAILLGLFMVSACGFGTLLEARSSAVRHALPDPLVRRALMGLAMGLTAIALTYSPWGRRSGAHMNPAVTLAFLRLGRVPALDALFYAVAQLTGAGLGVLLMAGILGAPLAEEPVRFVVTAPGDLGAGWAFTAELAISAILMLVVLECAAGSRTAPWTGAAAGALVALWITIEAPVSGTSMNPARTFGSAIAARFWEHAWIYAVAPPLGMLLAAEIHLRRARRPRAAGDPPACAKLHHTAVEPCIFCDARARRPPSRLRLRSSRELLRDGIHS